MEPTRHAGHVTRWLPFKCRTPSCGVGTKKLLLLQSIDDVLYRYLWSLTAVYNEKDFLCWPSQWENLWLSLFPIEFMDNNSRVNGSCAVVALLVLLEPPDAIVKGRDCSLVSLEPILFHHLSNHYFRLIFSWNGPEVAKMATRQFRFHFIKGFCEKCFPLNKTTYCNVSVHH